MTMPRQWIAVLGVTFILYSLLTAFNTTSRLDRFTFASVQNAIEDNATVAQHIAASHEGANASFAACVMTSDDNELLSEWIAYHYVVLPLRALVVANDPRSKQSPLDVLQKWENRSNPSGYVALQHWLWTDSDYMGQSELKEAQETLEQRGNHHHLKLRQKYFISACTKFFREQNRTWVSFVDSDEFIVFNKVIERDDGEFRSSTDMAKCVANTTIGELVKVREAMQNNVTVLEAIQGLQQVLPTFGPCHTMPRLLHGNLETANCSSSIRNFTSANDTASSFWDFAKTLTTLRYLQHAGKNSFENRWGKVIMDVSNLNKDLIYETLPRNIHRPYPGECVFPFVQMAEAPFRVHHYIGSWERFNSRSHDSRRTEDSWQSRSSLDMGDSCDLEIHKWLLEFVNLVGMEEASNFLKLG